MILIDTNALVILILGLIDPKLISKHKRTSIYIEEGQYIILILLFQSLISNCLAKQNFKNLELP